MSYSLNGFCDYTFFCDECGEELDTHSDDFMEALRAVSKASWKTEQVRGEWRHTCPDCEDLSIVGGFDDLV